MRKFTEAQAKELAYFRENVAEFLKDNNLRFRHVLISGEQIVKSFDRIDLAAQYASENFKQGEYIIQQVIDENDLVNFV
jgi:predicted DNA-binding WGR domain protein